MNRMGRPYPIPIWIGNDKDPAARAQRDVKVESHTLKALCFPTVRHME